MVDLQFLILDVNTSYFVGIGSSGFLEYKYAKLPIAPIAPIAAAAPRMTFACVSIQYDKIVRILFIFSFITT